MWKNIKITKPEHAFEGYANSYNVETFNTFNPELHLKDTESSIKSKLIELLTQLISSGWIIDSVIDHTISISKYNP